MCCKNDVLSCSIVYRAAIPDKEPTRSSRGIFDISGAYDTVISELASLLHQIWQRDSTFAVKKSQIYFLIWQLLAELKAFSGRMAKPFAMESSLAAYSCFHVFINVYIQVCEKPKLKQNISGMRSIIRLKVLCAKPTCPNKQVVCVCILLCMMRAVSSLSYRRVPLHMSHVVAL